MPWTALSIRFTRRVTQRGGLNDETEISECCGSPDGLLRRAGQLHA